MTKREAKETNNREVGLAEHIRTDPEAGARRLVRELGPPLHALALELCGGNAADADDLYMRTLERAVERAAEQRGPNFFAWMSSICRNIRFADLRRRALPLVSDEVLESVPDERPTPLEELLSGSDAAAVCAAVSRLPEPYREPVLLRYWAGLPHAGIAAALGLSEVAARQRLFQARARLRAELQALSGRNEK